MLGIDSFRQVATANAAATLKLENGQLDSAAPKGFFGRAVTFLRDHSVLPKSTSHTMQSFKAALRQEHGSEATRLMADALSSARKELGKLRETYQDNGHPKTLGKRGAIEPAVVRENLHRLTALINQGDLGSTSKLTSATVTNADRLTRILAEHKNDPMLKVMGPAKFLGYLLSVDAKVAKGTGEVIAAAAKMTIPERVALYGYTCADYKVLNPVLWKQTPAPDPGIKAYIDHAKAAIAKAPLPKPDPNHGLVVTERGVNNPAHDDKWVEERYQDGTELKEFGFISTTAGKGNGDYIFSVFSTGGGRDIAGFSAWPAEKEVVFPPGTTFMIVKNDQNPKHFVLIER